MNRFSETGWSPQVHEVNRRCFPPPLTWGGGFFCFILRHFGGSDLPNIGLVQSTVCILISLLWEGRGAKREERAWLGAVWGLSGLKPQQPLLHDALGAARVLSTALQWGSVCTPCSGVCSYSRHRWQVRSTSSVPEVPGLVISPSLKT